MLTPSQLDPSAPADPDVDLRLREFAHQLAETHTVATRAHKKRHLLDYLQDWDKALLTASAIFKSSPTRELAFSRAGEWVLDNFYIIKQTFRQIQEGLPGVYFDQLPTLAGTALKGHPRIFALAREWVRTNQDQIDLTQAITFLKTYQQVAPLTIGELWALPNMLRIAILERLVCAASELTRMEPPPRAGMAADPMPPGESAYEQALPKPPNEVVATCFLNLRLLSASDWKAFFEQASRVEQILRTDPAGIYAAMDFATRNSYRGVIEELARHSKFSEEQVALAAVELAQSVEEEPPGRKAHVGYYLRDAGRAALEADVHYKQGLEVRLQRALTAAPTFTYLGSIAYFCTLILLGLLAYTAIAGGSPAQLITAGVLGAGLALEGAITFVHWNVTHRIKPQSLPRMDFAEGIAAGNRTMVVVPTLLESAKELDHLLQELELYYLSNPDPLLTYALLTDFSDAPSEHMPGDEQLLALAGAGVKQLNHKYTHAAPFYLFHRKRQWNPSEGVWMGWERKRGKLADFNHLLLNMGDTFYTSQVGDASILAEVKYVITLDADTSLPQGSANRLVATLAHPLNQAEFSADGRSVVAGYTVLQPRVAIKPTSANRSLFSQIFAGSAGFDLYSFAVSDVYQDLFGEGSYVGKGIYDVAAFERSLAGQVRQNTLLSHDLFEGIYGRAALVTDITLYEEYPSRYPAYARRLRRWIRGDWQLLPWLFPIVRTVKGLAYNRLATIDLWKVFDNLRRSLMPPTLLALLAAGWLFLPGSPWVWTLLVLLPSALPLAVQNLQQVKHHPRETTLKQHLKSFRLPFIRWALVFIFLPHEALLTLGAVTTTLVRLIIARKNLLEWTTAANSARAARSDPAFQTWREMSASLVLTLLLGISVAVLNPSALWAALPLLVSWLIAPHIAQVISQPIIHTKTSLTETQDRQVRRLARRTWAFFEKFAGPNDHWLPPDHFQESPLGSVAHYTTPTNIGLFLVSTFSAYDLGYLGLFELAVRLRSTFDSLERLEHYRGHLLNWYDSQSRVALQPRYISTVDSGNLAASLITVQQGCLALANAPVLGSKEWQGLLVLLDILAETLNTLEKDLPDPGLKPGVPHPAIESFEVELTRIYERVDAIQDQPAAWAKTLAWLSSEGWERVSHRLMELLESHPSLNSDSLTELQLYLDLMQHHLQDMQRSLELFAPWLSQMEAPFLQTPAGQEFLASLPAALPSLAGAKVVYDQVRTGLEHFKTQVQGEDALEWCRSLDGALASAGMTVTPLLIGFRGLAEQADRTVTGMDFHFLFDERRQLFHIGYNVATEQLDTSYYDLLASEARIASLIAIAKGDVPQSHWQHLGRPVTIVNGRQVLLSWSGTMFEYLMPSLFTRDYAGTFIQDSCYTSLDAQIGYAREQHVPWGISESGYFAFDINQNYQYRAFGVPDLGYKRDLPDDLVIAPYASLLGLSLQPREVLENMALLEKYQMRGRFGLFESIDFTKTRLPAGQAYAVVRSYMAHHQGMILAAVSNYLLNDILVRRFHASETIQSVELLLQEMIPQNPPIEYPHPDEPVELPKSVHSVSSPAWQVPVDSAIPQVHLLSAGDSRVLITNAGGGSSQWRQFALTRWQPDTTLDQWGTWIYVQDLESGELWSATRQPIGRSGAPAGTAASLEQEEVFFSPHKVEFQHSLHELSLRTGVTISPDGVEIRRVNILNDSDRPRKLRLTSYGEVVMAPPSDDRRHPAFTKIFIESEYLSKENALVFQRRPRSANEKPVVLIHAVLIEAGRKRTGGHESDRAKFLGRSQTARTPQILQDTSRSLSGTTGGTLDPVFSLAQEIDLKPHAKTRVTFLTLAAPSRLEALEKLSHYQSGQAIHRAFDDAKAQSEGELLELGLNSGSVEAIQRILSALLYPTGALRAAPHILAQNTKAQPGLWVFGISGDDPILLVRVRGGDSPLLLEALQAFVYWRRRHLTVNLVILNEQDTAYNLDLHNAIHRQIVRLGLEAALNQRDGIFVLRTDQIHFSDRILLETVAGVILDEKNGTLAEHALRLTARPTRLPGFTPALSPAQDPEPTSPLPPPGELRMDNGLGGFSHDGREYVIHLEPGQHTPHPWINVIANPQFGFLVSEAGLGCTWAGNSAENRLTPWSNDPVTDMPGEALYLRDEETGLVWSPTPMPAGADGSHRVSHGAGYSIFESQSHGLNQTLRLFAAPDAPVKIAHLRLKNLWERPRRITVTYYAEWVLGTTRAATQTQIMPEFVSEKNALLASNPYSTEFGERVAFLAANKKPHGVTADRTEFLGRMGSLRSPAALGRIGLASAVNAGLDPCAAVQLHVDLAPGAEEEVTFLIGEGANRAESLALIGRLQESGQVQAAWQAVQTQWDDILNTVTVETPDPGMDLLLNRWLLYQALSCRLWGRAGLYQSSGAFGFRDQLQDVLALFHTRPDLARAQILEAARHQFEEGDVLHWWNPPAGRGVRTRISDDLLWLPFVTAGYVSVTGDLSILHEQIPFLKGEVLKPEEIERYAQYETADKAASLYEHCCRALEKGFQTGAHGLPLMGAGDWNDGMNRVGANGQGESIWLGWFLYATLMNFAPLSKAMNDDPAPRMQQAQGLSRALEAHAWDGEWYLRAFYDDGTPLGSHTNEECRIDSIAQSWAVLSGAADPQSPRASTGAASPRAGTGTTSRAAQAMESVYRLLVKQGEQMVLLFTPPFDRTHRDPGYIKGYLPGVRENGGQYTHAATWAAWAFARLGQGERAAELFHLLNPISHADTPEKTARYKVEPYVIAADIYSVPPHSGRGGWTWYTGSASWMYRLGLEAILGITKVGSSLKIDPCIPRLWQGFKVDYRFGKAHYRISVENPEGVNCGIRQILLDNQPLPANLVPMTDDGQEHVVRAVMGPELPML